MDRGSSIIAAYLVMPGPCSECRPPGRRADARPMIVVVDGGVAPHLAGDDEHRHGVGPSPNTPFSALMPPGPVVTLTTAIRPLTRA